MANRPEDRLFGVVAVGLWDWGWGQPQSKHTVEQLSRFVATSRTRSDACLRGAQ